MAYVGRGLTTGANYQKLDTISIDDATTFTMQVNSTAVTPAAEHVILGVNGVIQEPNVGFTVSGSTCTLASAIDNDGGSDTIWGVIAGNAAYVNNEFGSAVTHSNTLTVGKDDTGYDVKFFGATADAFMEWDEGDDELEIRGGAATPGKLLLSTAEPTVVDGNVLGRIDFQAPAETGADALLVGASIYAEADDTFAADNNETELVFATGASEAAAEKVRITSDGRLGIGTASPDHILEVEQPGSTAYEYAGNFKTSAEAYNLQVEGTHGGVRGTDIVSYQNSSSPDDGDFAGAYSVHYKDDAGSRVQVGELGWFVDDISAGTIDSHMRFRVFENNTAIFPTLTAAGVWTDASAAANKEYEGTRQEIFPDGILAKVKTLKVSKYHAANQPADKPITETHISPTAEDFWDTLQIGIDPRKEQLDKEGNNTNSPALAAKDLSGVALVAIQELLERVEALENA